MTVYILCGILAGIALCLMAGMISFRKSIKQCRDCVYCQRPMNSPPNAWICTNGNIFKKFSVWCSDARKKDGKCGIYGKYFER